MKFRPNGLLSLIWMFISAGIVITALSLNWPFRTALFPVIIGSAVFVMATTETLLCFFGKEVSPVNNLSVDSELIGITDQALASKRTFQAFTWIIGFVALVIFFGFNIAIPLFVLLFLKLQGKEGWCISLILTGLAWGFFFGLFIRILHTPFPEGWLFSVLNIV